MRPTSRRSSVRSRRPAVVIGHACSAATASRSGSRSRIALWVAIVLPLLGGSGALVRIFTANPTPFTYFHTLIDFVVVGLCIQVLALGRKRSAAS
jgi:hypothetical protein